jgi:hypothetical protein
MHFLTPQCQFEQHDNDQSEIYNEAYKTFYHSWKEVANYSSTSWSQFLSEQLGLNGNAWFALNTSEFIWMECGTVSHDVDAENAANRAQVAVRQAEEHLHKEESKGGDVTTARGKLAIAQSHATATGEHV